MVLISLNRIWAVMLRHLLLQFRDGYRLASLLFWPFFDIVIWGFLSIWTQQQNNPGMLFIPVIGAFFWQATARTSADVASSFMDELISKNITNMFSSPLRFAEYIIGLSFISALRTIAILLLCSVTIYYLAGYNMILMFGWWLLPVLFSLFISGIIMSLFSCALLLHWGMRAVEFIWVISWCTSAFIGAFFPITVLPTSMQMVGNFLPMTYAFSAVHQFTATQSMPLSLLGISFLFNMVYGIAVLFFITSTFNRALNRGLARLEVD